MCRHHGVAKVVAWVLWVPVEGRDGRARPGSRLILLWQSTMKLSHRAFQRTLRVYLGSREGTRSDSTSACPRPLSSVHSDGGPAVNTSLGASQTTAWRICDKSNHTTTQRQHGERKAAGEHAPYRALYLASYCTYIICVGVVVG
jgi:hypothetical protein